MATKSFNTRIINKHDIAKNWELAVNFVPEKGELIVYDIDENYSYERFKIGDGVKNVNALPFADDTKVTQTVTTTNAAYPLLLAPNGQTATTTTTSYFDSGVTLNPSTNTITANATSANAANVINIEQNTDLNTLTEEGFYGQAAYAYAQTMLNNPLADQQTGILVKVYKVGTGAAHILYQELHGLLLGGIWKRRYSTQAAQWSDWIQMATTEDTVAHAVQANSLAKAALVTSSSSTHVGKYALIDSFEVSATWSGYTGTYTMNDSESDSSGIFTVKFRTGSSKTELYTAKATWLSLSESAPTSSIVISTEPSGTDKVLVHLYWKAPSNNVAPVFALIHEYVNNSTYVKRTTPFGDNNYTYVDAPLGTIYCVSTVNIANNAASATSAARLTNSRTIALSGGATGTATSFDGSQNITIPVTAISPNKISSGYTGSRWYMNMGPENNGVIIPYLFNDFAHLTKRGGTAVIKYDGVESSTDLSVLFNGSMDYLSKTLGDIKTITIELTLPTALTYSQVLYIDSYATTYRAKDITLEVRNSNFADDPWTIKSTITDNAYAQHYSVFYHAPVGGAQSNGFNQVRYTFSNFAGSTFRLSCIGTSSRSKGLEDLCLSKKGGDVYGNITPYTAGTLAIGSEDKKFNLMYANQFIGILKGGLKSVDASAKSSYTQNLTYFRGVTPKGSATDRTYCSPFGNYADSNSNPIDYGSLIRLSYESKYYTDIWADANTKSGLVYRQVINGTSQGWKTLLDSSNYTNYIQAATDDEIIDLMKEMGDFPLLIDDSGNVYTDENEAILLI